MELRAAKKIDSFLLEKACNNVDTFFLYYLIEKNWNFVLFMELLNEVENTVDNNDIEMHNLSE